MSEGPTTFNSKVKFSFLIGEISKTCFSLPLNNCVTSSTSFNLFLFLFFLFCKCQTFLERAFCQNSFFVSAMEKKTVGIGDLAACDLGHESFPHLTHQLYVFELEPFTRSHHSFKSHSFKLYIIFFLILLSHSFSSVPRLI